MSSNARVVADRNLCTAIGVCESLDPDRFEIDDDGDLLIHNDHVGPDDRSAVEQAIAACPAMALKLLEADD